MTFAVLDSRYQYKVQKPLGSGGQGAVFRGQDLHTGAAVVIKILHEDQSPEAVARFEQEGRLAARIRDPHLVAALHFGVSQGRRYIVYESLAGVAPVTTLLELGRLDPFLVCDLALQLLGALDALHAAGVVHLDLAPGNCLWRERSSGRVEVFLADLGSAAATVPVTGGPRRSSEPVGTAFFMAPEMLEGGAVDQRADLWSLGALMYRLLVGHNVNRGNEDEPLEVPPPVMLVPKIPQAISDVVMTALAPAERRFLSAVAMAEAIDAAMTGRPPITIRVPRRTGIPTWAGVGGMVLAASLGSLVGLRLDQAEPTTAACSNGTSLTADSALSMVGDGLSAPMNDLPPEQSDELLHTASLEPSGVPPDQIPAGLGLSPTKPEGDTQPAPVKPLTWPAVTRAVQKQARKLRRCSTDDAVTLGLQVAGGRVVLESFDGTPASELPHHQCARKILTSLHLPPSQKLSGVVAVMLNP